MLQKNMEFIQLVFRIRWELTRYFIIKYESYTIIYYIYVNAFKFEKVGMAAIIGVVILIIILGLSMAGRKLFREES